MSNMKFGLRLIVTGFVFILHYIFPKIKIPARLDLCESGLQLLREEENRLRRLKDVE